MKLKTTRPLVAAITVAAAHTSANEYKWETALAYTYVDYDYIATEAAA